MQEIHNSFLLLNCPTNATNVGIVTCPSSNNAIATVNGNSGLVTAVSSGSVTITATTQDGNKTVLRVGITG